MKLTNYSSSSSNDDDGGSGGGGGGGGGGGSSSSSSNVNDDDDNRKERKNYTAAGKPTNTPTYKQWHLCCMCVQKEIHYERYNMHVRLLHLDCALNSVAQFLTYIWVTYQGQFHCLHYVLKGNQMTRLCNWIDWNRRTRIWEMCILPVLSVGVCYVCGLLPYCEVITTAIHIFSLSYWYYYPTLARRNHLS